MARRDGNEGQRRRNYSHLFLFLVAVAAVLSMGMDAPAEEAMGDPTDLVPADATKQDAALIRVPEHVHTYRLGARGLEWGYVCEGCGAFTVYLPI